MLRISLKEGENIIPLKTELHHAKCYVEIQKKRYGDIFSVYWDTDNVPDNFKLPKVIIQPLIENAIYHGIKNKNENGTIWITINKDYENNGIVIIVKDDGIGMTNSQIQALTRKLEGDFENISDHIGLQNVNQRIKITYGEKYGASLFKNTDCDGITVKLFIPSVN